MERRWGQDSANKADVSKVCGAGKWGWGGAQEHEGNQNTDEQEVERDNKTREEITTK